MPYKAFVFDAYGTLFDVHAAVRRHAAAAGPDGQALSEIWRAKQLEYSWIRAMTGAYRDFWQLTEEALDFAFQKVPSVDRGLRQQFLDAYWKLDCYPEVPGILKTLKDRGARLAILSNGSPAMLDAAVRSSGLDLLLDDVFSVDPLKTFKTKFEVYDLVSANWKLYPDAVSFQSSNRWDIAGAAHFGFHTVWINRTGQPDEYADMPANLILPSLDGLVTVL
ncbi:haloacid dehalogenase type II [Zhengella mangrovi]|uniref:(S)-2-haloacid dehalogenase n=1 Tax=Zhengella mangrovi TaxID=1982044 RepID=A0A2G1QI10_9HYPH|nr:haloacid dehalogenase type II [Zhengella mangrovi]PHP65155.1 haloacid dehalogenase type II [Zhengella mangrovi]